MALSLLGPSAIVSAVAGYVLCSIIYQIIHYRFFHPLAKFPGPFWGSVTRLWITYHNVRGREVEVCEALHRKHGPVVRITPTMLLVSDATKLPIIYHRAADKSRHYIPGSTGPTEALFNIQEHKAHARLRKTIAAPYSFTNIKRMEPLIDAQISRWIEKLDLLFASGSKKAFDFCPWTSYMGYDVVSEVGFGAPFGFIEQGRDVEGLLRGLHQGLLPFGILTRLYPLTEWIMSTWVGKRYLIANPEDPSGFGALMRFRDKLIAKRLQDIDEGKNVRHDLLQTFIDARDENDQPLSIERIKAETLIVLLAGADTTGTAFQGLVKCLLSSPDALAKLMAEIDEAARSGHLSSPVPQYEEVQTHCPYYVACVREAMRLLPSAPSIFPRLVSPGGMELAGKHVPEGVEVTANAYLAHRDTNVFGADAAEFRPERWLESEEKTRLFLKYNMTFGYGSRICLGQHVALMELFKAPLQLFRTFNVRLVDKERPARYRVKGGVAYFDRGWVTLERRQ